MKEKSSDIQKLVIPDCILIIKYYKFNFYIDWNEADDLIDETMKNNIGLKFAFRSTDSVEIEKTLKFFRLDDGLDI